MNDQRYGPPPKPSLAEQLESIERVSQAMEAKKVHRAVGLAEDHVDWFLAAIRPLLISYFEHGYKHGREEDP